MTVTVDARPQVSEWTETLEHQRPAIGVSPFDWRRDYGQIYGDCPSAFWLAPDAADTLPAPDLLHPRLPEPHVEAVEEPEILCVDNRAPGIAAAIMAAGPVFAASIAAIVTPLSQAFAVASGSLLLAPFTMLVGIVLSLIPISAGSFVMGKLGERDERFQAPWAWTAAGAASGAVLALAFGPFLEGIAAMTITGAVCARIARWWVRWLPRKAERGATAAPAVATSGAPA